MYVTHILKETKNYESDSAEYIQMILLAICW